MILEDDQDESAGRLVYLKSFDVYNEFLRYEWPRGDFAVQSRADFEQLNIPADFGAFTREGQRIAGLFATEEGPVILVDSQHVTARFGHTKAVIEQGEFRLTHNGVTLSLRYQLRMGLGANPYDMEPEDIDLFALIIASLSGEQFFRAYTLIQSGRTSTGG
jgi:hypothetical protein